MLIAAATAAAGAAAVATTMTAAARRRRAAAVEAARREEAVRRAGIETEADAARAAAVERAEHLRARLTRKLADEQRALDDDEARLAHLEAARTGRDERAESRDSALAERAAELRSRRDAVRALEAEIDTIDDRIVEAVERVAARTRGDLIDELGLELVGEARTAAAKAARALEDRVQLQAETEARRLIDLACFRYGTPLPADRLIATVELPRKAEIRERFLADGGALMKAITEFSDVEFEESDRGGYYMNAPNPYVREVGRLAFTRMARQRNPEAAQAEEMVERAAADLEKTCRDAGRRAARILKLKDVHPEILFLVGKLLYRTSYTQNQWTHAIETAHLCGMMAEDLGLDIRTAHRSALMHDIGKVLWAETEAAGSHAVSGAKFATDHGEAPEIVHPIAAHHNDEKPSSPLAHLVAAADALSGARPGARRETIETYTGRVDQIDAICEEFRARGMRNAYVISGGREVRVHVDPRRVDDLSAMRLSTEIAHRIEDDLVYPGQIKVMVIRETTSSAVAR